MEIITGKKTLPIKGIVYGVEGIGKTTFASKWPEPLFLDVENGSWQMDVNRIIPATYAEFKECIRQLSEDAKGFRTLVIDSADWLETMMIKHICMEAGINSIEKYEKGYGKGWNKLAEDWSRLLDELDRIRLTKGLNILFIAHSKIKRFEPADDSGHDRYTLTLSEKSSDVLKKWSDLTLFVKYDTFTVEENGKMKVKGGDKRVMYSQFHPCWDAKNRFGLPDKMPFAFSEIAHLFSMDTKPVAKQEPAAPVEKPVAPEPTAQPKDPVDVPRETADNPLLSEVERLMQSSGVSYGELADIIERKGVVPPNTPIKNYNDATLKRIIAGWSAIVHNIKLHRGEK